MEQHNDILANLNAAQKAAVTDYEHPSLIVAGAGSGKTRVLTCRIAHMISQGVAPYNILALTFTNKAAREMRERIETLVGSRSRYIWMGTFHSIFAKILFAEAEKIGYQPSFTIYDSSQSQSLIKSIVKEMNLDEESYKPRDLQARISLAKNNLVTADSYASNSALLTEDRERRRPEFAHIYKTYQQRCKANNAMDFDDLLLNINILFRDHQDVLEKYQQKFAYILVDEYQDTNYAQYIIIRRLAQQHSRVCVVGDDAQSIYSFRGAKIENIFQFQKDFPGARVFKLEQNYRSTQNIVNAANSVIEKNSQRIKKNVFSENETGEKIKVLKAYTDGEEAQLIADGAKSAAIRNGGNWNEIAVLYRTNAQSRVIEETLRKQNIPFRIYGGHSFYDHKEIKDMLAYFKLIINPNDDESFKRIINFPARGIGSVTVERIATLAKQKECSMWQAVESLQAGTDEAKTIGKRVLEFAQLIKEISLQRQQKTLYEFGLEVATRSGILPMYRLNPSPDSESALANIEELLNSMQDYRETLYAAPENEQMREPTIEEWLQNVSLLTDMDNDKGEDKKAVTLMTVHSAKGLEFDTVFIAGMEENLFPSIMCLTSPRQLEEERRLFYVALTRAKHEATILYSETRYKWGNMEFCKPSRFIKEIDPKYLDMPVGDDDDDNDERSADEDPIAALRRKLNKHYAQMPTPKRPVTPAHGQPTRTVTQPTTPRPDTSGMKRMGTRHMVHNEGESNSTISAGQYTIGQHVVHPKFGSGTIIEIEQLSNDIKLKVKFNDPSQGTKTLLSKFAKFLNI